MHLHGKASQSSPSLSWIISFIAAWNKSNNLIIKYWTYGKYISNFAFQL
jgi:hypothetical protein